LKKQFKQADFSVSVDDEIGLKVKWGNLSYERSLEKDLKKIFG
jgi:hypothetical protein